MTEKDLAKKLNNLKNIEPDTNWLKSNRELFLTQIANSGANSLSFWQVFAINMKSLAKASAQPVLASVAFLLILIVSSVFSHKLFSQAKPNDSLYIARVVSEKVKLNTVLDSNSRDKMAVKFAANHAKDISEVLANINPDNPNDKISQEDISKLNKNFNEKMEKVEQKMAVLTENKASQNSEEKVISHENDNVSINVNIEKGEGADVDVDRNEEDSDTNNDSTQNDEDVVVSIAADDDYRDGNGIQVSENDRNEEEDVEVSVSLPEVSTTSATGTESTEDNEKASSSTEEIAESMIKDAENNEVDDSVILEIREMFAAKDYKQVIEKLNQISESME